MVQNLFNSFYGMPLEHNPEVNNAPAVCFSATNINEEEGNYHRIEFDAVSIESS